MRWKRKNAGNYAGSGPTAATGQRALPAVCDRNAGSATRAQAVRPLTRSRGGPVRAGRRPALPGTPGPKPGLSAYFAGAHITTPSPVQPLATWARYAA